MLYGIGIIGHIAGLATSSTQNVSSLAKKFKNNVANSLPTKSFFSNTPKNNQDWKKDYPDIAEMCITDKNIPHNIALLFEDGTKTNQTSLTNDTLLIEVTNQNKKAFITLDKTKEQFATTKQWNDGGDNKITLHCDGKKYDINLPWSPEAITLEDISRKTRIVSESQNDLDIIFADSTKKKL